LRAAVLAASAPGLAKPAGYLAASGAAGLDRLGLRSAALALARFARKVLQRDGARAALRVAADERRAG
jgi:hypothetical protein